MKLHTMSVNGALSDRIGSHRASWVRMRAVQEALRGNEVITYNDHTKIDFASFGPEDTVMIYLGMEWSGGLNLFGGANDENAIRLGYPTKSPNPILFLDEDPIDLLGLMRQRKFEPDSMWGKVSSAARAERIYKGAQSLKQPWMADLIVGDSHSLSQFSGIERIHRFDGQTLHGALAKGLWSLVYSDRDIYKGEEKRYGELRRVTFYLGSIDIRFHIDRQSDPYDALTDMMREYYKQLVALKKRDNTEITLVAPMPIETEDRKMSKTGYYKGKPFYGSLSQRQGYRNHMIDLMLKMAKAGGFKVLGHPEYFAGDDGVMDQKYMEPAKGVHLSWEFSRYHRLLRGEQDVILYQP